MICSSHTILWSDQIGKDEMGGALVRLDNRYVYRLLVGKPEGKRLLGRPDRWWQHDINLDVKEVGLEHVDWI